MEVKDYRPINCENPNVGCVQQTLAEQHWEASRVFDQRKMWITGLYLGGVAYSVINYSPCPFDVPGVVHEPYVPDIMQHLLFVMFLAGIVAFLAMMKLHYLSELHMAKAQVYVGGIRRGIIFDFHIKKEEAKKSGQGEDCTPEPDCLCLHVFFWLSSLTSLYSIVIVYAAFICGYYYFAPWERNLPTAWMRYAWHAENIVLILIGYVVIRNFESALKRYARKKAFFNVSEGFHDVRKPDIPSSKNQ